MSITTLPSKERLEWLVIAPGQPGRDESNAIIRALLAAYEQEPIYQVWDGGNWADYDKATFEAVQGMSARSRIVYPHPAPIAVPEPVAAVELSDYVTAAQLSGDEPRKKAVKELYEGALVVGQNLYTHLAPIPAAVPDGYVLMPLKLTAENGAKYALSGEFHV